MIDGEGQRDGSTGRVGERAGPDAAGGGHVVVRVSPRVAVAPDGDALVVAQLDRSTLRRLEGTAAELWARLEGGASVDDLVAASLHDHPEADPATVQEHVAAFVEQLRAEGLVESVDRAGPVGPTG